MEENNNQPENENNALPHSDGVEESGSISNTSSTLPIFLQGNRKFLLIAPLVLFAAFLFNQQFGGPSSADCDRMMEVQEYLDGRIDAADIGIISFNQFINQWDSGVKDINDIADGLNGQAKEDASQIAVDAFSVSLALSIGTGYAAENYSDMTYGFDSFFTEYCN